MRRPQSLARETISSKPFGPSQGASPRDGTAGSCRVVARGAITSLVAVSGSAASTRARASGALAERSQTSLPGTRWQMRGVVRSPAAERLRDESHARTSTCGTYARSARPRPRHPRLGAATFKGA